MTDIISKGPVEGIEIPTESSLSVTRGDEGLSIELLQRKQGLKIALDGLLVMGMLGFIVMVWMQADSLVDYLFALFLLFIIFPFAAYVALVFRAHARVIVTEDGFVLQRAIGSSVVSTRTISKDVCGGVVHDTVELRNQTIPCLSLWDGSKSVTFGMELGEEDRKLVVTIVDAEVERLRLESLRPH